MIGPLFIGPRKIISRIAENSGGSRFLKKKNMKYRSKKKERRHLITIKSLNGRITILYGKVFEISNHRATKRLDQGSKVSAIPKTRKKIIHH